MPLKISNWRKSIPWLSPLLLVSLGLHGLALLIPLPNVEESMETADAEPTEMIQVTELPPTAKLETPSGPPSSFPKNPTAPAIITPSSGLATQPPSSAFAIRPESPVNPVPSTVLPQQVLPQQSTAPPASTAAPPTGTAATPPASTAAPSTGTAATPQAGGATLPGGTTATPQAGGAASPGGTTATLPGGGAVSQGGAVTQETLRRQPESTQRLNDLLDLNSITLAQLEQVKKPLNLSFPADDYCIRNESQEVVTEGRTSVGIVIEEGAADFSDGETLQTTGADTVDAWIKKTVFPTDVVDPNEVDPIETPEPADLDIFQWINDNYGKPLFEDGETKKVFTVSIKVNLTNNCR